MIAAMIQENYLLTHIETLPLPGKVLVHPGQDVEIGSPIAEAILPARFQVFDVLNHFRIRTSDLEGCIKRLAGEDVQKGDVIARKPGFLSHIFRAPEAGKVVSVRDGRVTLAMGEKTIQITSPITGVVSELIPGLGASIVARGTAVRAAWGNGKIGTGLLRSVESLKESDRKELADRIIVLNSQLDRTSMSILADAEVTGVVVAALDPMLEEQYRGWKIPLISLVGFGETVLDQTISDRLSHSQDQLFFLMGKQTPILFMPDQESSPVELFAADEPNLLGSKVRLLGMPYFGSLATIVELPEEEERLGSGVLSKVAVVERDDATIIRIPLENLEILSF